LTVGKNHEFSIVGQLKKTINLIYNEVKTDTDTDTVRQ